MGKVIFWCKCCIFIALLLFISPNLEAQTPRIDSLQAALQQVKGKEKAETLLLLCDEMSTYDLQKSLELAKQAKNLADSLKIPALLARAYQQTGLIYINRKAYQQADTALKQAQYWTHKTGDPEQETYMHIARAELYYGMLEYDSATMILKQAEQLALNQNLKKALPDIYNNMAKSLQNQGYLQEAISLYLKAAGFYQQANSLESLATVFNNIGTVHRTLKNYPEATKYLLQAIDLHTKADKPDKLILDYNNLGAIYMEALEYEKSRAFFNKAIDLIRKQGTPYQLARTYMNLANLLKRQDEYKQAEKYYDSTLIICREHEINYGIMITNANLAELYVRYGETDRAISMLQTTLEQMQQYEMPSETAGLHKLLYEAYKKKGAYEKALQQHELYTMITDSISNLETKKTILELEKKYNREQDAREIAVLKQSVLQKEARNRYYIIAALVALIVLLMVLVLFYLRRRSARFREELARKENEKLKATNDLRNKELVSKALQIANMNETVSNISEKIKEVTPSLYKMQREAIIAAIREFEISVPDQAWAEFETRFEQVHEDFYNQLKMDFPQLTPTEIKICSFLRLNLSTKEISALTYRGVGTIDNARSSIRRKLNLGQDDNLTTFLLNL